MNAAPGHVIASCFALSAFVVGLISGLAAQNPAVTVLVRALLAMIICYPLGVLVGVVCQRAVNGHVAAHRRHPDGDHQDGDRREAPESEENLEVGAADVAGDPAVAGMVKQTPAA
ncbi:MAG: hypothetical protein ACYTGR_14515 [Planctomycetota bacterium]|jgi:hypothetical protein